MNFKVIGISGYARSGKDTLFEGIKDSLEGYNVVRVAFADPLKHDLDKFLIDKFGISAFSTVTAEKEIIRPIMVAYGESKRKIDPEYWLKKGLLQIKPIDNTVYIFTDVRYKNEAEALQEHFNAEMIFIEREGNAPANENEAESIPPIKEICNEVLIFPNFEKELPACSENTSAEKLMGFYAKANLIPHWNLETTVGN